MKRILSLDILRGMTVTGMIFVNNGYGETFEVFRHAEWNGMTPCDCVFPFFLFIMGVSSYLSLTRCQFKATPEVLFKVVKRVVMLFMLGVFINWTGHAAWGDVWCFDHLRIWAVLQRIALCYLGVSLFALFCNHRYVLHTIVALLITYAAILFLGHGYENDATVNFVAIVDHTLFGKDHLYAGHPIDPEGLVGTISGIAHALIGFYCGMLINKRDSKNEKLIHLFVLGAVLVVVGFLLSFILPFNKPIWSPSFVLATCGFASLLLGVLMYVIDVKGYTGWTDFFHVFGVNALALYASSEFMAILFWRFGIPEHIYNVVNGIIPGPPQLSSMGYALIIVFFQFCIGYVLWRKKIFIKL